MTSSRILRTLGLIGGHQVVGQLENVFTGGGLRGMKTHIDPGDGLPFPGQSLRASSGVSPRPRLNRRAVSRYSATRVMFSAEEMTAYRWCLSHPGHPHVHHLHPARGVLGEMVEPLHGLFIGGQVIVGPHRMSEEGLGGHGVLAQHGGRGRKQGEEEGRRGGKTRIGVFRTRSSEATLPHGTLPGFGATAWKYFHGNGRAEEGSRKRTDGSAHISKVDPRLESPEDLNREHLFSNPRLFPNPRFPEPIQRFSKFPV